MKAQAIRFVSASAALFLVAAAATVHAAGAPPAARRININQASAAQLAYLPRVGVKVAARIVEYRTAHGPFSRPEDIMEVKGIGEKLFLTLKPYVTVSGPTTLNEKIRLSSTRNAVEGTAVKKPAPPSVPLGKGR